MTVGFRNCACCEVSYISGASPSTVVSVVSITGRNRSAAPSMIDGINPRSCAYSSMVETSTMESLMMIPVIPNSPTTVNMLIGSSHRWWPQMVPTRPNGMIAITTIGRVQLEKIQHSTR